MRARAYHFREDLIARLDAAEPDLLVLDDIVLAPKWRKLKLGLLAIRNLVDLIGGGSGLAVSGITSLRYDPGPPSAGLVALAGRHSEKRRAATMRLRRRYRCM